MGIKANKELERRLVAQASGRPTNCQGRHRFDRLKCPAEGVEKFDLIEGVWVTEMRCKIPVAIALRQSLIELSAARQANDGQQTKMEMVYQYLTGPRFRHRVEAIVEKFSDRAGSDSRYS
jgi:hypothetical protein